MGHRGCASRLARRVACGFMPAQQAGAVVQREGTPQRRIDRRQPGSIQRRQWWLRKLSGKCASAAMVSLVSGNSTRRYRRGYRSAVTKVVALATRSEAGPAPTACFDPQAEELGAGVALSFVGACLPWCAGVNAPLLTGNTGLCSRIICLDRRAVRHERLHARLVSQGGSGQTSPLPLLVLP